MRDRTRAANASLTAKTAAAARAAARRSASRSGWSSGQLFMSLPWNVSTNGSPVRRASRQAASPVTAEWPWITVAPSQLARAPHAARAMKRSGIARLGSPGMFG